MNATYTDTHKLDIAAEDAAVLRALPSYDTPRHGRIYKYWVSVGALPVVELESGRVAYRLPSGRLLIVQRGAPENPGLCRYAAGGE